MSDNEEPLVEYSFSKSAEKDVASEDAKKVFKTKPLEKKPVITAIKKTEDAEPKEKSEDKGNVDWDAAFKAMQEGKKPVQAVILSSKTQVTENAAKDILPVRNEFKARELTANEKVDQAISLYEQKKQKKKGFFDQLFGG
ncbi:MAG: hypothetical protein ABH803_01590 [Candidatus Micrarchaeota archaeon]